MELIVLIERAYQLIDTNGHLLISRRGEWVNGEWVTKDWEVCKKRGDICKGYLTLEEALQKFIEEQENYLKWDIIWKQARLDGKNVQGADLPRTIDDDSDW